jgi:hypothetical protein
MEIKSGHDTSPSRATRLVNISYSHLQYRSTSLQSFRIVNIVLCYVLRYSINIQFTAII